MSSLEAQHPVAFDDLYRDLILEHYRHPRNQGDLPEPTVVAEGLNPSCGDELRVALTLTNGVVSDIRFRGRGCSISQASASMMTEEVRGRSLAQVHALSDTVQEMLTHEDFDLDRADLGDLEALQGVVKFPVRIKCALLAWKVLDQDIADATGDRVGADTDIQTRVASSALHKE